MPRRALARDLGSRRKFHSLSVERLEDRSLLTASVGQIGINFVGGATGWPGAAVTGPAGMVQQANWNSVANNAATSTGGAQTGTAASLIDDEGTATAASVSWSANNTWIVATAAPADGNDALYKGYLDTTATSTTTVSIIGVPYSTYDVYIYFDGDAAGGRSGIYGVNDGVVVQTQGPYFDWANWPIGTHAGAFALADEPGESGNYAVFRGLTGADFTVTARPTNAAAFRAPLNAVQIVGYPALFVVNALGDVDDGNPANGTMTLREAVNLSNISRGPAEITFDLPAGFQVITLSGSELLLSDDVKIIGSGVESLMVNGNRRSRVFRVAPGVHAELSGLWIADGDVLNPNLTPSLPRWGGGIFNDGGSLTIERCWIQNNQAEYGGGIENAGHSGRLAQLTVRDSTISYNRATEGGGLDSNGYGGAAAANVIGSTIAYNEANLAGGVYNYQYSAPDSLATLDITNSTISGNTARRDGGGVVNGFGVVMLTATTVTKNDADADRNGVGRGGGLYNLGGETRIARSIVADNAAARDADLTTLGSGGFTSLGQNWFHRGVPGAFPDYRFGSTIDQRYIYSVVQAPDGISWEQANSAAVAWGGHLVTITSQEENQRVAGLAPYSPSKWANGGCCSFGPWIGGRQSPGASEPAGGWTWVTDEPFTYTNWYSGEPNDFGGVEHHLELFSAPAGTASGQWNDMSGDSTFPVSYIVEYDALAYQRTDVVAVDPRLLPLTDNGGPTWTHALPSTFFAEVPLPYHQLVSRSAPVAWWHLNETSGSTAIDAAGGHHGTTSGSVVIGQIGAPIVAGSNLAADFDNGRVVVPYQPDLNSPTFSVEAWVKLEATSGGPFTIVSTASTDVSGNTSGYELSVRDNGDFQLRLGTGTPSWSTHTLSSQRSFDWDGWNYIMAGYSAFSRPDANGQYLGGYFYELESSGGVGGSGTIPFKPNSLEPLLIGGGNAGAPFFGKIDEVAIYDRNASGDANRDHRARSETYVIPWRITPTVPATQTSTWFDLPQMAASRAVDGDAHTFSHTAWGDPSPEWRLDLGASQAIGQIVLHNRRDCCGSRLRDITVEILAATGQVVFRSPLLNPENVLNTGSVLDGPPALVVDVTKLVGGPVTGRTIVVRRTPDPDLSGSHGQGDQGEDYLLQLAEVQVFLTAPDIDQRGITRPRGNGFDIGSIESTQSAVVGRHLFYNFSSFDGSNSAANANDDAAIATDKTPLLPGQTATFANYTSFARGINGIMIDIADLGKAPTLADWDEYFAFRVGNSNDPSSWSAAPPPIAVTTRPGAGASGSDRITLIWPDGAIRNQWLEVTVRPGLSGLTTPDVFYFGSAVGETGNQSGDTRIDFADRAAILERLGQTATGITDPLDINRGGQIAQADLAQVEANYTALTGDLDSDDAVTLADLAILQANLNSTMTSPYKGDLDGSGKVDRDDVAAMMFGDPAHRFGARVTDDMLKNRLVLISIPVPSPAASSTVAPALADAALAVFTPASSRSKRLFAARVAPPAQQPLRTSAVDRVVREQILALSDPDLSTGATKLRTRRSVRVPVSVVERSRSV